MISFLKCLRWSLVILVIYIVYIGLWLVPALALYYLELFIMGPMVNDEHFLINRFDNWLHSRLDRFERRYRDW